MFNLFKNIMRVSLRTALSIPLVRKIAARLMSTDKGAKLAERIKYIYFSENTTQSECLYLDPSAYKVYIELKNNVQRNKK